MAPPGARFASEAWYDRFVLAVAVVVLQLAGAGWATARPVECGASTNEPGGAANVWERAKSPELRRYCDLVASGAAKLAGAATVAGAASPHALEEVLVIADAAERAQPGRPAPLVLRGRALARLGRYAEALRALDDARARDERALDDPAALLAWARMLARAGNLEGAEAAYRALLPRASTLGSADRGAAAVEAGLLAFARGPAGVTEAVAIFRQARRDAQDVVQTVATLSLALALDRLGEHDEARALLTDRVHGDPRPLLRDARVRDIFATAGAPAEADALAAFALEASDPAAAREAWKAYVDAAGPKSPWIEHARTREAQAGRRGVAAKRPPKEAP